MSEAAVMSRPVEAEGAQWIEMDEYTSVDLLTLVEVASQEDLIEVETATVVFDDQESMRFGPRSYTADQAEVIRFASRGRRPLKVAPLPLEDE